MSYDKERYWADQYIFEIKKKLATALIETSSFISDTRQATDLITIHAHPMRIACRVRRPLYYKNATWRWQFTIRTDLPSGKRTELAKIRAGWGDYYFYAFAAAGDQIKLEHWRLLSLDVFRKYERRVECDVMTNKNGSEFRAYRIEDFPPDLLIDSSEPPPRFQGQTQSCAQAANY